MKNIIFVCLFILTISCKEKRHFYHGVVVNVSNKPLDSVIIKELPITMYEQLTITYKNGQFKLYRDANFITSLIFSKKGYITDTVKTVGGYNNVRYKFLNKTPDTLVLKK